MGESTYPVFCTDDDIDVTKQCPRADDCVTHLLWIKLGETINAFLDSTTLEELYQFKPE